MGYLKIEGVKQHDITDCAAACISAIARWYGLQLPLITIREVCGSNQQGTSIKGIIDGCNTLGFEAIAMKSGGKVLDDLKLADTPAILHIENEKVGLHFVVLCGTNKKGFVVMDPALGKRTIYSEDEMASLWSGYIIFVKPTPSFKEGKATKSLFSHLSLIVKQYKRELIATTFYSLLYIIIGISTSIFIEQIIDVVIPSGDYLKIATVTILMGSCFVLALVFGYYKVKNTLSAGFGIDYALIGSYIKHLFRLPVSFFDGRGSGELNSRISDAVTIRDFLTSGVISVIISVFTLIISFILMFTFHWKLALFTLLFLPLYVIIYSIANKINKKMNRKIIESSALFEEQTVESISSMSTIKYNCFEREVSNRVVKQYLDFSNKLYKGGRNNALFALGSDGVSKGTIMFLLTVGSIFIIKGELTIGELMSFYSILAFFSTPLMELVGINNMFSEAKISAERLFEIMEYKGEDYSGERINRHTFTNLSFNTVNFCYPGCFPLISNFSAKINCGEITAITGESGCGKSTLASLLMRGYQSTSGYISVDGVNINDINLEQWRNLVAIVPQDSVLMNATILENISGWSNKPNIEKVAHLIADLGLADFIQSLPCGLLTRIGERGAMLSGGQRQRIALARALYKEPSILILDEATSSLDSESESYVLALLNSLKQQGLMIIMITHKIDNIKIADKIINLGARQEGDNCTP